MEQLTFTFETPSALLTPDEIFQLVDATELLRRLDEDNRLERKPSGFHPRSLGEYVCMWANTAPSGGLIAIGIEDKGVISGCHRLTQDQINSIEKAAFVFCSDARTQCKRVAVTASDGTPSFVILVRVFYREDKVVFDSGNHAYVRIGDEKHALGLEEIRELQIDRAIYCYP
jgi:ATP-dependent DNA helicase RecG